MFRFKIGLHQKLCCYTCLFLVHIFSFDDIVVRIEKDGNTGRKRSLGLLVRITIIKDE
jgi:hypothetical protein